MRIGEVTLSQSATICDNIVTVSYRYMDKVVHIETFKQDVKRMIFQPSDPDAIIEAFKMFRIKENICE